MKSRGGDRAAYIREMIQELGKMARADGRDALAYMLEIAELEAQAGNKADATQPVSKEQHEVERVRRRRVG